MNLLLTPLQFQPKNIQMCEIKQNKMMSGIFTKLEYKDELMVFNGIYIAFSIENPICEQKEKVYRNVLLNRDTTSVTAEPTSKTYNEIQFNITPTNYQTITQLSQIEASIIQQYIKYIKSIKLYPYLLSQTQKKHISIKHNLYNQKFKLYNSFMDNGPNTANTFMLKISGIWEDDTHIGLTYKILQVNPVK